MVHRSRETENVLGRRILQARRAAGLTRTELADRVGLRLWHIERFETTGLVAQAKIGEIAAATGKPLSWFIGEAAEAPEPELHAPLAKEPSDQEASRPREDDRAQVNGGPTLEALETTAKVITDLSHRVSERASRAPAEGPVGEEARQSERAEHAKEYAAGESDDRGEGDGTIPGVETSPLPIGDSLPFEGRHLPGALRGYDRNATDELLEDVYTFVREVCRERDTLTGEVERLRAAAATGQYLKRELVDALVNATREARAIREKAVEEARQTVEAARQESRQLLDSAEREAKATASRDREPDSVPFRPEPVPDFHASEEDISRLLRAALKWLEQGNSGRGRLDSSALH